MEAFKEQLGDLNGEFLELVAAETALDEALEPAVDAPLPLAWGKYTILREIARGAAGVVYEAVHRELGRKVALKVLRTGLDTDDTTRERFRREAQALAQIEHDHIVDIYEFGEIDGRPFYAMTLINGPTLAELVKRDERPTPEELCVGLAGVANALQALHDAGIIHRDVKPSNIMIAEDGRYMLADFGLARTAMSATMTRTGDALGTPLYMSPEQMLGSREAIEARTDVYGLGATMYQLLTGKPPFKTENLHALMRMVLSERPEPARAVAPELPAGCSRMAMKCLEKEPRDRYESAAALEEELLAFAHGGRVYGKPLSLWQRSARQVRKHPVYSVAATVLCAFAIFLATRPGPPELLSVETAVLADVSIDGQSALPTPLTRHVLPGPGRYTLVIEPRDKDEYLGQTLSIVVEKGVHRDAYVGLQPVSTDNPAALKAIRAASGGGKGTDLKELGRDRSGGDDNVLELWLPRGLVRLADAKHWEAHVGMDLPPGGGVLEFLSGDVVLGTVSFPEPQQARDWMQSATLPPKIADQLKPGMKVTWRFKNQRGKIQGLPATFEIADPKLDARLAAKMEAVERTLKPWKANATKTAFDTILKAEALMAEGLYSEAFGKLRAAARAKDSSRLMIATTITCLRTLLASDKPTRKAYPDWELWSEMRTLYNRYDKAAWATFLAKHEKLKKAAAAAGSTSKKALTK